MPKAASNSVLKRLQKMLPSLPYGPPIPRKEIVALLKQLQKQIDAVIRILERGAAPRTAAAGMRRRRAGAKSAKG